MDKKTIRLCFAGLQRSQVFLGAVERHPAVCLTGFCDIVEQKAQAAASKYNANAYTDYLEMLEHEKPDAVVLATPVDCHAPKQSRRSIAVCMCFRKSRLA